MLGFLGRCLVGFFTRVLVRFLVRFIGEFFLFICIYFFFFFGEGGGGRVFSGVYDRGFDNGLNFSKQVLPSLLKKGFLARFLTWFMTRFLTEIFSQFLKMSKIKFENFLSLIVKFIYSEKATKFCKIFTLLLSYVVSCKSKVKILQNFVAFSEYMNFKMYLLDYTKLLGGGKMQIFLCVRS